MNVLLLIIIVLYQAIETILSVKEINKLKEIKITEKIRIKYYQNTILFGWIPIIILTIFIILNTISINDVGLRAIKFSNYSWLNIITITIVSIASLFIIYQIVMFLTSAQYREAMAIHINKKTIANNHYDRVINDIMLPKTNKEKTWFSFVSLTAGICEETIWRGTLLFLLQSFFPSLNIIVIVLISSALFGLFHSYQGITGVIKTGLVGILFNLLFIVSNSLIIGVIFHFLIDFSSVFILTDKEL